MADRDEDDFVFAERLEELNEELEVLNSEASELEERIANNVAKLLEEALLATETTCSKTSLKSQKMENGARLMSFPNHKRFKNAIAERKRLYARDILIETAGGGKDRPTGRTQFLRPNFVQNANLSITCASFCRFIRIDERMAHPEYVFWLLQHIYAARFMLPFHTQHTGVSCFQYTTFATTLEFTLPDRTTQRKIASILWAYDDLIENNTRRIAILEEMAQAIYREWFVNFRFPGHENVKLVDSPLGQIPEGWEAAKLGAVSENFDRLRKPLSKMQRADMKGP